MIDLIKTHFKRLPGWFSVTGLLILLVGFLAFQQLGVLAYKTLQVTFGLSLSYLADRALFKNVDPVEDLPHDIYGAARLLARAIIALGVLTALAIGL